MIEEVNLNDLLIGREFDEALELVDAGADIRVRDRDGRTPLLNATIEGELRVIQRLVERGANVNDQESAQGYTALHFAAKRGLLVIAEFLLKSGASVDAQDVDGNTPLSNAVYSCENDGEMIGLLLSHGADRNLKNYHDVSPLDLAREISDYDVEKFLA